MNGYMYEYTALCGVLGYFCLVGGWMVMLPVGKGVVNVLLFFFLISLNA